MKTTINLETLCKWSAAKRVETRNGPRNLRTAPADNAFWTAWKSDKETLKAAGISCTRSNRTGNWEVCWWLPLSEVEKHTIEEKSAASRAVTSEFDPPRPVGLDYLPYQKAGIAYSLERSNVLIADEMGLGKTIQAIGIWNCDATTKKTLVICPATLRLNWKREFEKWAIRPVKVAIVNGGKPSDWPTEDFDALVINFDVTHKHKANLSAITWDLLVADEIHRCKNPKSLRTKTIFGYKDKKGVHELPLSAKRRVFLTGTPIVNRPVELWTMLEALDPNGLGKNFFSFAKRYTDAKQTRWGWDFSGASRLDELQRLMRERFMVRRLKADVLTELPAKRRQIVEIPANGASKAVANEKKIFEKHEAYLAELDERIREAEIAEAYDIEDFIRTYGEDMLPKLRAEKAGALRIAFTEMSAARHEVALAKVPYVVEHLEECIEAGPVICFAHHKDVIAEIAKAFDGRCVVLTGETSMIDRQKAVDDFQNGKVDLFIGNILAAGVGITLTRSCHVVFGEEDWVPGNISQAEDRAHRIGQTETVLVQHIVLEDSVDAIMVRKVIAKQEVIDKALDTQTEVNFGSAVDNEVCIELKKDKIAKEAAAIALNPDQKAAIHQCLKILAGMCDGAYERDGCGFNKMDSRIGKMMAASAELSDRQAVLGKKFCIKYHRQIPAAMLATAKGD